MKRPQLTLQHLTNTMVMATFHQILLADNKWLTKQYERYHLRGPEYRERLDWASKRLDFQKELLSRLDKFNWVPVSSAIDLIFETYQFNADPSKCHFSIEYCGLEYPKITIHKVTIDNKQK